MDLVIETMPSFIILVTILILGYRLDPNTPIPLCRGYERFLASLKGAEYSHSFTILIVFQSLTASMILLPLVELATYITIYYHLYKNNELMEGFLPILTLQRRKRKNIITLSGQSFVFLLEVGLILVINSQFPLVQLLKGEQTIPLNGSVHAPLVALFVSSTVGIAHFWSCSDLREYFGNKMSMFSLNLPRCPMRGPVREEQMIQLDTLAPPPPICLRSLEEAQNAAVEAGLIGNNPEYR